MMVLWKREIKLTRCFVIPQTKLPLYICIMISSPALYCFKPWEVFYIFFNTVESHFIQAKSYTEDDVTLLLSVWARPSTLESIVRSKFLLKFLSIFYRDRKTGTHHSRHNRIYLRLRGSELEPVATKSHYWRLFPILQLVQ